MIKEMSPANVASLVTIVRRDTLMLDQLCAIPNIKIEVEIMLNDMDKTIRINGDAQYIDLGDMMENPRSSYSTTQQKEEVFPMLKLQKTKTDSKERFYWKVNNLTAYPGYWYIGHSRSWQNFKFRSVAIAPVTGTRNRLWFKKLSPKLKTNVIPWRQKAIQSILDQPSMGLRLEWLEPVEGLLTKSHQIIDSDHLKDAYEKGRPNSNVYPRLTVFATIDRSTIGDPDHALWLIRKGVKGYQHAHNLSNMSANIGYLTDSRNNLVSWVGWKGRELHAFKMGDALFDPEWVRTRPGTPYTKAGHRTIKSLLDSKESASLFAHYLGGSTGR